MGVMVGGGAGGSSVGVAPDATWIAAKIFNDHGTATSTGIHLAFQWLLDPDRNPATADAPDVVNDSWTMSAAGCNLEFQSDLRSLRAAGILPVFAAGNDGPAPGTVFSPANNPEAFAVGGTDNSDALYPYSSRGPAACAAAVAPRLAAPAVDIRTTDLYGLYATGTGTSLAAPHVAGALALLLSAFPDLPADRQQAALESGAVDLGTAGPDNDFGYGRLDVAAAYHALAATPDFTVALTPASVSVPAGGSASYTVSAAGVNGFAGDVTLSLAGLPGPVGTATFNPAVIAAAGSSQLTIATVAGAPPGSYPLTITGTSGPTTRTTTAMLVIPAPPDFSLAATPATQNVNAGGSAAYTVAVGSLNGFAGTVALSLTGLPGPVGTATFNPAVLAAAGSSQLTIATAATAPPGSYPLTITGTSGSTTHTGQLTLVVNPRDFTLAAGPSPVTVSRGQTASYTVTVAAVGAFTGTVSLSVTGLPARTTAAFSANPVGVPGTSVLRIRTTALTARGTYTVRITGTNGSLVHQVTVTLTVR
jgi:hypothetical protein